MITERIRESVKMKLEIMEEKVLLDTIGKIQEAVVAAFRNKRKVLFCGNGGSAADAQHLAAELSGRFYKNRPALYAEALHCNTSYLTAVANDFSFADIYARLIEGEGTEGDLLFAISTSGNSKNILTAAETARKKKMLVVGMTGRSGGKLRDRCDYLINIPSDNTPRIQEGHIMIGHIICEQVEEELFPE